MHVAGPVLFLTLLAACATVGAPRPKDKAERTPVDPPTGEWWVEKYEDDGGVIHERRPTEAPWAMKFTSDKMVLFSRGVTISERPVEYFQNGTVFEIDLSPGDPKTMRKGIWKIDGDLLLICCGAPGADRPVDFTAREGSGRRLWTLKRK